MPKTVALANSLHHGVLRVRIATRWEERRVALFNQAIGVVSAPPQSTPEGKTEWIELVRVADMGAIRADEKGAEDLHWPFSVESHAEIDDAIKDNDNETAATKVTSIVSFQASTETDRDEWVRALQLAKQLATTRSAGTRRRRVGHTEAFVRFASSDSDDCDSDSVTSVASDMSVEQFCRLQLTPMGAATCSPSPVATAAISVVDRDGKSISVSIPLTRSQCQQKPLHQIKLRALEELRIQARDAEQSPSNVADAAVVSLDDLLRHEADFFVLHFTSGADLWLKEEQQPLSHYIKHGHNKGQIIALSLEPQSAMPFPTIQLSISATKNKVSDLSQKSYTAYLVDVHFNDMNWQVQRRFKEFHKLHHELKDKYPNVALPKLPSKHVFTPLEGQFVNKRRLQLERYTRALADHPQLSLDVLVLSFLGVVSTSRDRDLSKNEKSVIHVTALHVGLDYGDIILFSCRFGASVLQRKVTGSTYDHVGIVVPGASRNLLRILEATGEGIQVYSLKARLMAYSREVSKAIVVRRFTANRTPETLEKMTNFVKRVDGNPYSILGILQARGESEHLSITSTEASTVSETTDSPLGRRSSQLVSSPSNDKRPLELSRRQSTGTLVSSPTKGDSDGERPKRKYFCSSLAAAALKEVGWLKTTRTSSYFWPGSFEEGGEIEKYLAPGVTLGKETVVDCRIVEVGLATTTES